MPLLSGRTMLTPWLSLTISASISATFLNSNGTVCAQPLPEIVVWTAGMAGDTAVTLLDAKTAPSVVSQTL